MLAILHVQLNLKGTTYRLEHLQPFEAPGRKSRHNKHRIEGKNGVGATFSQSHPGIRPSAAIVSKNHLPATQKHRQSLVIGSTTF
jgi:hypothetical protein